ncbi:MAG: OmpA family protein [Planctomycetota bacterium]
MGKNLKTMCIITGAMIIITMIGCVSNYKKQVETLKHQNWELKQTNEKLESDVVQLNHRMGLLLKDPRRRDIEPQTRVTPVSKQEDGSLMKRLKSKGLEVISRDGNPAVIISGLFESGSVTLSSDGKKRLKEAGKSIKSEVPVASFRIDGYTDNMPGANEPLSLKRANTAKDFLVRECGFDTKRISTKGMGAKNPITDNKTKKGREKNRRLEIVIIIKQ